MGKRTAVCVVAFALAIGSACQTSYKAVDVGGSGRETSPAESGNQGEKSDMVAPYGAQPSEYDAEHQTAGVMPEYTNGLTDATMEGSGNLAAQGSYERDRKERQQNAAPAAAK